jgi:hypothetical protein
MVSGVPTASGFEERIRFSELEIVDANAIDTGVLGSMPEGNYLHGWDVNVAGVRMISVKRNIRYHKHAVGGLSWWGMILAEADGDVQEFLLRIKRKGELEHFVARRYGDFARLHKNLRTELPGKVLPSLPRKNKSDSTTTEFMGGKSGGNDSEVSSMSSASTRQAAAPAPNGGAAEGVQKMLSVKGRVVARCHANPKLMGLLGHQRLGSGSSRAPSPRPSVDGTASPARASPKPPQVCDGPRRPTVWVSLTVLECHPLAGEPAGISPSLSASLASNPPGRQVQGDEGVPYQRLDHAKGRGC